MEYTQSNVLFTYSKEMDKYVPVTKIFKLTDTVVDTIDGKITHRANLVISRDPEVIAKEYCIHMHIAVKGFPLDEIGLERQAAKHIHFLDQPKEIRRFWTTAMREDLSWINSLEYAHRPDIDGTLRHGQ